MRLGRKGYLLTEALMTVLLMSIAMVALNAAVMLVVKSGVHNEGAMVASQLSYRLLEEIRLRRWDEKTPTPPGRIKKGSALGVDGGESASDKRDFDDVDDFDGWTESPPRDPAMGVLTAFSAYGSSVSVGYVSPTSLAPSGSATDFKNVSVCSWSRRGAKSICLQTLITNR